MNISQRIIGWWVVVILFAIVEGLGLGIIFQGETSGPGPLIAIILGVAGLGVWVLIAAISRKKDDEST